MYYIFTAYYYILFQAVARQWPQSAASAASITPGNYHVFVVEVRSQSENLFEIKPPLCKFLLHTTKFFSRPTPGGGLSLQPRQPRSPLEILISSNEKVLLL